MVTGAGGGRGIGGGAAPSRPARIPVSAAQRRMLFIESFEPGQPVYNLPLMQQITGPLDRVALEAAFSTVVARHEALRTDFVLVDGEWTQQVAPLEAVSIPLDDLRDADASVVDAAVVAEVRRPFDLGTGPKIRARLLQTGDDEHLLSLIHI